MSAQQLFSYHWPRPALTVDAILVAQRPKPSVLLIQRKNDPFSSMWALPGGFVDEQEPLAVAAARELLEETSLGMQPSELVQVGAYGNPGRDPRGWTVGVAFACLLPEIISDVKAADDARDARWFGIDELPERLAFDHAAMIRDALHRLSFESSAEVRPSLYDLKDVLYTAPRS